MGKTNYIDHKSGFEVSLVGNKEGVFSVMPSSEWKRLSKFLHEQSKLDRGTRHMFEALSIVCDKMAQER